MEIGDVVCTNCPSGQRGTRCELCEDGFHGDPLGRSGLVRQCERCDCNGNVDPNALGVCDHMTGRCFKCLGHTEGDHCQRCRRGYYGDAMDRTMARKCKRECVNLGRVYIGLGYCDIGFLIKEKYKIKNVECIDNECISTCYIICSCASMCVCVYVPFMCGFIVSFS
ncbi:unnamed protein product [Oncorhynchus mykiss]|uniref:Laminin EGF-like domain-containing protein n=1 Tax=Oncorhynchus mykiss TaxID=8022 RepID=A0A061A602_ONCMY|nr:unnamed protein product [Oncorhynchus mykiss]